MPRATFQPMLQRRTEQQIFRGPSQLKWTIRGPAKRSLKSKTILPSLKNVQFYSVGMRLLIQRYNTCMQGDARTIACRNHTDSVQQPIGRRSYVRSYHVRLPLGLRE